MLDYILIHLIFIGFIGGTILGLIFWFYCLYIILKSIIVAGKVGIKMIRKGDKNA